jgi:hypothetical protein
VSSPSMRWILVKNLHHRQACGENLRKYGNRMDAAWSFRSAYDEARKIKIAQDEYCRTAEAGEWDSLKGQDFPESLKWEVLVDVLRGRVKVREHPGAFKYFFHAWIGFKPLLRGW